MTAPADQHPFVRAPHRTLLGLSLPVLFSLVAEPLTGLADTAFIARLGTEPLAALGVGTVLLSSLFWIFNFLGIGTQTEVARTLGAGAPQRACQITGMALAMAGGMGLLLVLAIWPLVETLATAMGATAAVQEGAATYIRIRLFAVPAVIITTAAFGALRGLQDMRTPLWIAATLNAVNIVLDAVLIFGLGPFPALGIAGAAWATAASQWLGAIWAIAAVRRRLGFPKRLQFADARKLMVVGRDLVVRTGLLTLFLLLTTRAATRIGAEAGAAHQAIRQVWVFTALVLDAYAHTAQSLVGYFLGARRLAQARRVALIGCGWSFFTGVAMSVGLWLLTDPVARLLVPAEARAIYALPWLVSALSQPLNALSFATDGIHWGTSDYAFLRNAMVLATGTGAVGIYLLDETAASALPLVWVVTAIWIAIRAALGVARIWPGIGAAPLAPRGQHT